MEEDFPSYADELKNDVIKCVKDNGDPDGDLSEMEEVYDEMCTEP